ncbi:hypothetical protein B0H14DRAFT_3721323 [Mycena olivaceomarginata]|nr:hypothetical protein B0H14DRAFT_3721323 [Mycena olivaceomarginata]
MSFLLNVATLDAVPAPLARAAPFRGRAPARGYNALRVWARPRRQVHVQVRAQSAEYRGEPAESSVGACGATPTRFCAAQFQLHLECEGGTGHEEIEFAQVGGEWEFEEGAERVAEREEWERGWGVGAGRPARRAAMAYRTPPPICASSPPASCLSRGRRPSRVGVGARRGTRGAGVRMGVRERGEKEDKATETTPAARAPAPTVPPPLAAAAAAHRAEHASVSRLFSKGGRHSVSSAQASQPVVGIMKGRSGRSVPGTPVTPMTPVGGAPGTPNEGEPSQLGPEAGPSNGNGGTHSRTPSVGSLTASTASFFNFGMRRSRPGSGASTPKRISFAELPESYTGAGSGSGKYAAAKRSRRAGAKGKGKARSKGKRGSEDGEGEEGGGGGWLAWFVGGVCGRGGGGDGRGDGGEGED